PFKILFLAALLLLVNSLLALKHFFTTLKKILLCERQSTALARILLDCGVVTYVATALQAIVRHSLACASNWKSESGPERIKIRLPRGQETAKILAATVPWRNG